VEEGRLALDIYREDQTHLESVILALGRFQRRRASIAQGQDNEKDGDKFTGIACCTAPRSSPLRRQGTVGQIGTKSQTGPCLRRGDEVMESP